MTPADVLKGAKVARRMREILQLAARGATDPVAFCGGLLAGVVGQIAGMIGPHSTGELLRTTLAQLERTPATLIVPDSARADDTEGLQIANGATIACPPDYAKGKT